ncbi:MAG: hypothetical protein V4440_08250 [Pseudomonadota bacterium]
MIEPPSSVKLPAQANDAPSNSEDVKVPEQLLFTMLEDEIEVALAAKGERAKKHKAQKRRDILFPID